MPVQILDGAIGTELISRGLSFDAPAWSAGAALDAPAVLAAVHADYAQAGATWHTANTFRTQPRACGERWQEALEASVAVARGAVPPSHRVLGSMAPVADCYRPDLSPREGARSEHREVARALASAGCDALLCETFADEVEAVVAAEEALETGLPVWVSLTAGPLGDLLSPDALGRIARRVVSTGVARVLVNCVAASRMQPYVDAIASIGCPTGVYANAGGREEGLGWEATSRDAADAYAALAQGWVDAGATVIGGCCGTGPLHIKALAERFA